VTEAWSDQEDEMKLPLPEYRVPRVALMELPSDIAGTLVPMSSRA